MRPFSLFPDEAEVLFAAGAKFCVTSSQKRLAPEHLDDRAPPGGVFLLPPRAIRTRLRVACVCGTAWLNAPPRRQASPDEVQLLQLPTDPREQMRATLRTLRFCNISACGLFDHLTTCYYYYMHHALLRDN